MNKPKLAARLPAARGAAGHPGRHRLARESKKWLIALFRLLFILGIAYIILNPLLTKVSVSFMSQADLYDKTVKNIPKNFTLTNYADAVKLLDYWPTTGRTALLSGLAGLLQMVSCTLVGYGFARYSFRFKRVLFALVVVAMVVPPQLILTPLYLNFQNFELFGIIPLFNGGRGIRLVESFWPFVLLGVTAVGPRCGLYIFLARQVFRGYPKEIEEAASIDGANHLRIFARVILPGALPTMVTIFLFSFVWQWNDSLYTFLFYTDYGTLAKALSNLGMMFSHVLVESSASASNIAYYSIMESTGVLLAILPLLVIYGVFQKQFIQSVERAGIVG